MQRVPRTYCRLLWPADRSLPPGGTAALVVSLLLFSPPAPPSLELLLDRDLKDIARRRLFSPPCAVWGSPSLFCTNPAGLGVALLASTRMWVGNSQRQRQQMWVMREEIKSTLPSWHWLRVNFVANLTPTPHTPARFSRALASVQNTRKQKRAEAIVLIMKRETK